MQHSNDVDEYSPPNSQLKLMHEVNDKHGIWVKPKWPQLLNKCTLVDAQKPEASQWMLHTNVDTSDSGFKMRSNLMDVMNMPISYSMLQAREILSARKLLALGMHWWETPRNPPQPLG
jgi:hypothetical protein